MSVIIRFHCFEGDESVDMAQSELQKDNQATKPELKRTLGLLSVVTLGVGSTVGAGIFSTLSQVAQHAQASSILVLAFVIGSLFQIPCTLCFAELGSAYPVDGGYYIYYREAGSKPLAFLSGWISLLATDAPSLAIATLAMVNYMGVLLPVPEPVRRIIGIGIILLIVIFNLRSVKGSGIFQSIITIVKIIPFIIIICMGLAFINEHLFLSNNTLSTSVQYFGDTLDISNFMGFMVLLSAVAASSFAYEGLCCACYMSGEIKNQHRNLPLGLILSVLVVMVLYTGLSLVSTGLLSINEIAYSTAPVADIAAHIPHVGVYAEKFVAAIAIVVIFGTLSSCIMYQPRLEYAMAKDGLFFKSFARIHPKYHTPHISIIFQGVIIIALTFVGNLDEMLGYFTIAVLLRNLGSFICILILRKKQNYKPSFVLPGGAIIPVICIIFDVMLLVVTILSTTLIGFIAVAAIIISGLIAYKLWDNYNNKSSK